MSCHIAVVTSRQSATWADHTAKTLLSYTRLILVSKVLIWILSVQDILGFPRPCSLSTRPVIKLPSRLSHTCDLSKVTQFLHSTTVLQQRPSHFCKHAHWCSYSSKEFSTSFWCSCSQMLDCVFFLFVTISFYWPHHSSQLQFSAIGDWRVFLYFYQLRDNRQP